jgi:hypothetical protein
MNTYDMLKKSSREWFKYPSNLLRPGQRKSVLKDYESSIIANDKNLFLTSDEEIHVIEPASPDDDQYASVPQMDDILTLSSFKDEVIRSPANLHKHLQQNRKDPRYCLMYLNFPRLPKFLYAKSPQLSSIRRFTLRAQLFA